MQARVGSDSADGSAELKHSTRLRSPSGLMEKPPDREREKVPFTGFCLFIHFAWPWMDNLLGNKRIQGQAEPVEGLVALKMESGDWNILYNI